MENLNHGIPAIAPEAPDPSISDLRKEANPVCEHRLTARASYVPARLLCALCAVLFMVSAGGAEAPSGAVTAYIGAAVLDMAGDHFVSDAVLLVGGDRIIAAGRDGSVSIPKEAELVRLDGRFIIPGLVNSHVHLATLANPREARAYLRRELYSGVTAVRDMAGDARLLAELKREAAFDEIVAPDVFYAALMAGPSFFSDARSHDASRGLTPGTAPWMRAVTPATDLTQAVAEARGTGATAIKLYGDLSESLVRAVTAEAHRQHLLVWAHAAVFPASPADVVAAGVDVMSHADFLAYEGMIPTPHNYAAMKEIDLSTRRLTPAIEAVLDTMKDRGIVLDATIDVGFRHPYPKWPPAPMMMPTGPTRTAPCWPRYPGSSGTLA
jgi:hypothetical protein